MRRKKTRARRTLRNLYIKNESEYIFVGLVIKEGQHFRLNNKKNYTNFKEKQDEWEYLEESIQ